MGPGVQDFRFASFPLYTDIATASLTGKTILHFLLFIWLEGVFFRVRRVYSRSRVIFPFYQSLCTTSPFFVPSHWTASDCPVSTPSPSGKASVAICVFGCWARLGALRELPFEDLLLPSDSLAGT